LELTPPKIAQQVKNLLIGGKLQVERATLEPLEDSAIGIREDGDGLCAAAFDAETDAFRYLTRVPTHRVRSIADLAAEWQVNAERAAFARNALHLDRALILAHQLTDNRQPEPRALRLGGKVRLEDPFHVLG
jgi:hypothetical protein